MESQQYVKENVLRRAPLSAWWLVCGLCGTALALVALAQLDVALPAPRARSSSAPQLFIAENAYEHLLNLTAIGPRVAGSYENEVLAVGVIVEAVKSIARSASPHNRVELDVFTASGAFPLSFLDGMNNVYRDVSMVVARVRGAGARAGGPALLLNCHIDTVPDSPGASDDGAGCAVLLETLRAMAAARGPLRHSAIFLFNGAEENIMQASHGFITQHKWAKSVRAFINIEACGAGGREVLFQAGPHDPWIMEIYAGAVPHPFASSVAQELFQSGLIPADTDFRIFRDFGALSGVDLAWSANGYVYHTRLDTADGVPPAVLQRTGDNVLALALGMVASGRLDTAADPAEPQPVYFDVLGTCVVCVGPRAALGAALAALALLALQLHAAARRAAGALYISYGAWWRRVWRAAWLVAGGAGAGVGAAVGVALGVRALGAPLPYYSRAWLAAPLYGSAALAAAWAVCARGAGGAGAGAGGAWRARALHGAVCAAWGAALAASAAARLRSGFVPLAWVLGPAGAALLAGERASVLAALPAALQTCYLALGSLRMFVPLAGRAGSPPLPADALLAALVAALLLAATSWMLPLLHLVRRPALLIWSLACVCAATCVLVTCTRLGAPYSARTPQRLMVFHTRRTVHPLGAPATTAGAPASEHFYWIPHLDDNTPHSVDKYVPEIRSAVPVSAEECARWVYCGVPYYLPVLSLVSQSSRAPAAAPPLVRLAANASVARLAADRHELTLDLRGPAHVVVIVSPAAGARVAWSSAVAAPRAARGAWGARPVYVFTLHAARGDPAVWRLVLHLQHAVGAAPPHWADVSAAGHAQFGARKMAPAAERLRDALPPWVAHTGWGVDLHLFTV